MNAEINPYAPPTAKVDQTTEAAVDDYVPASRSARFFGAAIDNLFAGVLFVVTILMVDLPRGSSLVDIYTTLAIPFLLYGGIQWTLIATSGQSIGKKLLGTKIVCLDGSPCGFAHGVILRSWIIGALTLIPGLGSIAGFIDGAAIFGGERRCVHDMIAGTRVIYAPIQG